MHYESATPSPSPPLASVTQVAYECLSASDDGIQASMVVKALGDPSADNHLQGAKDHVEGVLVIWTTRARRAGLDSNALATGSGSQDSEAQEVSAQAEVGGLGQ